MATYNNESNHKAFWMLALLLLGGGLREASAALISLGTRIPLTPTTFALPVEISDAIGLTEWTFELTYDPTDVLIHTGCDPFGADPYCSLVTGPVTEGDFFAGGAPFNLLVPGFISLDPVTLTQSGSLFGVQGAFGGVPPGPSGSGTLAFIQFLLLGDGEGPIDVGGGDDPTPVPEPGAFALLAMAFMLPGIGWLKKNRSGLFKRGSAALLTTCALASGSAGAQIILPPTVDEPTTIALPPAGYPPTTATSAVGPYFAIPSWDQKLAPNVRFVILTNFGSDAVLDRETGLVWARQPAGVALSSAHAVTAAINCLNLNIAGRGGWRLPTAAELLSLVDFSIPSASTQVRLPSGHPFVFPVASYWTSETFFDPGFGLFLTRAVSLRSGTAHIMLAGEEAFPLCVRGRE
jgi:hypothetical protein